MHRILLFLNIEHSINLESFFHIQSLIKQIKETNAADVLSNNGDISSILYDIELYTELPNHFNLSLDHRKNMCVSYFLNNNTFTHILFLSPNIFITPKDIKNMITFNKEFTSLVPSNHIDFSKKKKQAVLIDDINPKCNIQLLSQISDYNLAINLQNDPTKKRIVQGFLDIDLIQLDAALIHRDVFIKIIENSLAEPYGSYSYPLASNTNDDKYYAFFKSSIDSNVLHDSHYNFCKKWKMLNGEIWANISSPIKQTTHIPIETCYKHIIL